MGIGIEFTWTADPLVESPAAWDTIAFFFLGFYTLFCVLVISLVVYYQKRYAPLRAKSPGKLVAALIFSLVHLWSLIVSNEQIEITKTWSHHNCPAWNFWLPYFIGLNSWFIFMIDRMITYGLVFQNDWDITEWRRIALLKTIIYGFLSMPTLVICILDSAFGMSYYQEDLHACVSTIPVKVCLLTDIVIYMFFMALINGYSNLQIRLSFFNESRALNHSLLYGFLTLIAFAIINFSGLQSLSFWRSLQLELLLCMYLFCFLRLAGYTLYKAIRNDHQYEEDFHQDIDPHRLIRIPRSLPELLTRPEMIEDFLDFCATQEAFTVFLDLERTKSRIMTPLVYVACIRSARKINIYMGQDSIDALDKFYNLYFDESLDQRGEYVLVKPHILIDFRTRLDEYRNDGQINDATFLHPLLTDLFFILGGHYFKNYITLRARAFIQQHNPVATETTFRLANQNLLLEMPLMVRRTVVDHKASSTSMKNEE